MALPLKKKLAVAVIIVSFFVGCMAAFDLGAKHTCHISDGTLLDNYVCLLNGTAGYCKVDNDTYKRPMSDVPVIVPWLPTGLNETVA